MGLRVPDDVGGCPTDAGFRSNLVEACRSESDDVGVGWGKDWGQQPLPRPHFQSATFSFLHVGQFVHLLASKWVELTVYLVELVVYLPVLLLRLDGRGDFAPVGARIDEADRACREQHVAVAGPYGLFREVLRPAGHVGDYLGPQATFRPT